MRKINLKTILKYKVLYVVFFGLLFFPFQIGAQTVEFKNIKAQVVANGVIRIEWTNNVATIGEIIYGDEQNCLQSRITENKSAARFHSIEIANFQDDQKYYYQIIASDGNSINRSYVQEIEIDYENDTEDNYDHAPEIDDLEIKYISASAAAISWTTDVPATSNVEYGLDSEFGKKARNSKKVNDHLVILKKLKPGAQYFIKVYSFDEDKVQSSEHFKQFYTLSEGSRNEDELNISNFRPNSLNDSHVSATFITLSFKTNNLANGYVTVKKKGTRSQKITFDYNTKHYVNVMDLKSSSCYNFYLYLKDIFGNRFKQTYNICTAEQSSMSVIDYDDSEDNEAAVDNTDSVVIAGIEYERFPRAKGIFKTNDSSKLWFIANSSKHLITNEEALNDYDFFKDNIKIVSWPEIAQHKDVRLVKSPDENTVYYLHKRQDGTIAKISIPSPQVFTSYGSNRWEDIVTISQNDIDSYESVKLLRNMNNNYVYYIIGDTKHFVSNEVFLRHGFTNDEVLGVSTLHLNSFLTGDGLK